jgi:hypothetical protein
MDKKLLTITLKSNSIWQKIIPQPTEAWSLIIALIFFNVICLSIGVSKILVLLFPLLTFFLGWLFYNKYPVIYIGYTWWIWFISPFVARLVEYQNGWANPSMRFILLAPYLVTGITGISFFTYISVMYKKDGLPFFLAFVALCYAFCIGLIQQSSPSNVIEGLLSWMPAIFWGFHLIIDWRNYSEYKKVIQSTFCWGILLMSIYGLVQYFNLPPWDKFWIDNAEEIRGSVGWSEIRIWSTLNLPIAFTNAIVAGLLLIISKDDKGTLSFFASTLGSLCLLLARVRSSWVGFAVGLLTTIAFLKSSVQMRTITIVLLLSLCLLPLVLLEPFHDRIVPRLQTLTNLQEDGSINARFGRYEESGDSVLANVLGSGLGTRQVDAGLLAIVDSLGWLGTIPYLGGLLILFINSFSLVEAKFDPFISASRAISLSMVTMTLGNNMMVRFYGVILWGFLGITIAGHKYYQHQKCQVTR